MLDGITVLSQNVHQFTRSDFIGIIILCLFCAILTGMISSVSADDGAFGLGVGICVFIIIFAVCYKITDIKPYTTYKVTISEDVDYLEFTNKYEVLSQDGQIYEIREKEIK